MKALLIFPFAAACLLLSGCNSAPPPVAISNQPASINGVRQPGVPAKPVPLMSWTGLDGSKQQIEDLQNKVLILDFWATYCAPCREEIPHLNSILARYGQDKVQIVGLNVGGDEDQPKIPAFVKELNVSYPVAFPEDALVSYIFGDETAIPQTAVFDRQGRLVLKVIGFDSRIKRQLDDAVEQALRQ